MSFECRLCRTGEVQFNERDGHATLGLDFPSSDAKPHSGPPSPQPSPLRSEQADPMARRPGSQTLGSSSQVQGSQVKHLVTLPRARTRIGTTADACADQLHQARPPQMEASLFPTAQGKWAPKVKAQQLGSVRSAFRPNDDLNKSRPGITGRLLLHIDLGFRSPYLVATDEHHLTRRN